MYFTPPRALGLLIGGILLAILLALIIVSVVQLTTATISAWLILWVTLPLVSVPLALLVLYRLYNLLTARYRLDRDGFYLTWGLITEQISLAEVTVMRSADELAPNLRPARGLWWPGYVYGGREIDGEGLVEFFATTGPQGLMVLSAGERLLAISPPDLEAFQQAFVDATRLGSLEPIPTLSLRPEFVLSDLWNDRLAQVLVLIGLALPLTLLGYLALRVPSLPIRVPFGFDTVGVPSPMAPPGRLLLLPMIGGLCWIADFAVGAWLYRQVKERPLAYAMWGCAIVVGGLFWGATLQLLESV
ncbi:MAG: hypothetical protein AMJ88_10350 [Anaerolineae bacterium SM23_ 63]|nr:MAG: hypothetical protein AMJ88_10350 [Anaerolineae bacterium SM23_ 63]HEY47133.1 hypothetical protein [Anaerolineae bacterium]